MGVSERQSHGCFLQHQDLGAALQCRTAIVQAARRKRALHPPWHHPSACLPESRPFLPHTKAPCGFYPFSNPHLQTRTFAASFLSLLPALNFFMRVSTSISICSTQRARFTGGGERLRTHWRGSQMPRHPAATCWLAPCLACLQDCSTGVCYCKGGATLSTFCPSVETCWPQTMGHMLQLPLLPPLGQHRRHPST